ncbi:MAG: gamma-glutamyl-gamma-aminobutyrate hydrolase family protein [Hydrogenibacillus sp.]|nr:gamma-glutamyl-gamma-aminobutyrate hydrolase family protein [Hydrogenibacillus sp.]
MTAPGQKPLIGLVPAYGRDGRYTVQRDYLTAVEDAGGVPVIWGYGPPSGASPPVVEAAKAEAETMLARIDGLMLTGGDDIDPWYFGEAPHPALGEVTPERDAFEVAAVHLAVARGMPLLGICRGAQVINVALGGDLYQDLTAQYGRLLIQHQQRAPRDHPAHAVRLVAGSRLQAIVGRSALRVNSFHHQAVRRVAPGWVASAHSEDGVVEAIERVEGGFGIGVQWHAEALAAAGDVPSQKLFRAFVESARAYRSSGPK